MFTYQDFLKAQADRANSNTEKPYIDFIFGLIQDHKRDTTNAANYKTAVLAEEYYTHRNRTIVQYQKILYDANGNPQADTLGANYKMSSNFLFQDIAQLNQYLLSNGVTWKKEGTAKRVGKKFDKMAVKASGEALKCGVSFAFVNYDHIEVFTLREFVPLYDEITNQLMAGVRFWRLSDTKPLRATVYTMDGVEELIWGERDATGYSSGRVLKPLSPYITVVKGAPADPVKIYDGENYATFPIVPFYGINKQSELIGRREQIDAYDLIKSGFANTVDEAAYIYWAIEGGGGMKDMDLEKFKDRMRRLHAAAVGDDQKVTANTVEAPYASREALLARIRNDLYEDFMMLDISSIKSGSVVTAQIDAVFHNINMKANEFEYNVLEWLDGICSVLGIDDEEPTLTRDKITNIQELVSLIVSSADYLTEDYVTRKILLLLGDGDLADEIIKERTAEDMERITVPEGIEQAAGRAGEPAEGEGEQWTEDTNSQNRS